jgi:hypothetical protein
MIIPNPIIIFVLLECLTAGNGWLRGSRLIKKLPQKLWNPNRPVQPIPTFDRKALSANEWRDFCGRRRNSARGCALRWRLFPTKEVDRCQPR